MPIQYDPKDASNCWPEAAYDAVLEKVEDSTSKRKPDGSGGNPMQVLTWRVYNDDGREQVISDYIVFPSCTFKLKQLAIALGKKDEFDAGTLQADDQVGCSVKAELVIEKSDGYDDKNKIKKVKAAGDADAQAPATVGAYDGYPQTRAGLTQRPKVEPPFGGDAPAQFTDDDIPFAIVLPERWI